MAIRKKLIYTGSDVPGVHPKGKGYLKEQDLAAQVGRLKTLPFDGIAVEIRDPKQEWPRSVLGNNLFSGVKHEYATFAPVPGLLRALKQTPLTENFLLISPNYWFSSGARNKFDWFDERRWATTEENLRLYARLAKESGVIRGFLLDVEGYTKPDSFGGEKEWAYNIFSLNHMFNLVNNLPGNGDPKGAYFGRVRERGRRFFRALDGVMTGAPLLLYLGYGLALGTSDPYRPDLFPHFLDGVLEEMNARKTKAVLIDGAEDAYKVKEPARYREIRAQIFGLNKGQSSVPGLYEKYVRLGLGKWLDVGEGGASAFDAAAPAKNFYTPESWEGSVREAMKQTDEYVWVWTGGQARFFPMTEGRTANVPAAYIEATRRARRSAA